MVCPAACRWNDSGHGYRRRSVSGCDRPAAIEVPSLSEVRIGTVWILNPVPTGLAPLQGIAASSHCRLVSVAVSSLKEDPSIENFGVG